MEKIDGANETIEHSEPIKSGCLFNDDNSLFYTFEAEQIEDERMSITCEREEHKKALLL